MAILIKRYANRKLYNTETSRYITLKGIAELLEGEQDVRVIDNETGEDITSVTLSQILVDTERSNRAVPGNLLSGLFQKPGETLYDALRKGVDDASEGIEEFQRNMRKLLANQREGRELFTPPDIEGRIQEAIERVFKALDLPRRSDIEALNAKLDRVAQALEKQDAENEAPSPAKEPLRSGEPLRKGTGTDA